MILWNVPQEKPAHISSAKCLGYHSRMKRSPALLIDSSLDPSPVWAALVWGSGILGCLATKMAPAFLQDLLDRVQAGHHVVSAERKMAVRNMLRYGSFKPAGRSKPASEYLLAAAADGFPLVNGPVDVNNAVSLQWGYPASIFDATLSGWDLMLRRGLPGERYIFNPSGQTIELEDLLCVCRKVDGVWVPCGNAVKDSMATKTSPATTQVVAVICVPVEEPPEDLRQAAKRFASLLASHCGATQTGFELSSGPY
jgi:DNA/RNA-binding domain of Phe-tRNA-synthetase-like protein